MRVSDVAVGGRSNRPLHQDQHKKGCHGAVEHVVGTNEFPVDPLAGRPNREQQHGTGFQSKNGPRLDRSEGQRGQQEHSTGRGQQRVVGKPRLRRSSDGRGLGLRCQGGTHEWSLDCSVELSGESSLELLGESSKLSSQSLPRIGEPEGKRSIPSSSSVVD